MGSPAASRRQLGIAAAVVIVVAVGSMARSAAGDFVWDDRWLVLENPAIRGTDALFSALGRDYFHGAEPTLRYGYYRPLSTLSLALTHQLVGEEPMAYHVTNLATHAAVSVLLLFIGLALGLSFWAALLGALLFAVHPVHVESVCWVSGRTDLLAALFGFAALLLFIRTLRRPPKAATLSPASYALRIGLATLLAALAVLAKEIAFVVPLLVLLICRGDPKKPVPWKPLGLALAPLLLLTLAYGAFRAFVVDLPDMEIGGVTPAVKLASAGAGVIRYLALFFAPTTQVPYMRVPMAESLFSPLAVVGLACVAAIGVAWARGRVRWGWHPTVLLAGFVVSLLPLLNFVRITSPHDMGFTMAERFLYVPSAMLCLLCGELFWRGLQRLGTRGRAVAVAAMGALLLLLAATSHARAATWQNELALFEQMIQTSPGAPLPHVLHSQALRRAGAGEAAAAEAARAAELFAASGTRPPAALSVTVAGVMLNQGRLDDAARLMEAPAVQALEAPAVHRDLATIYRLQGRFGEAEAQLERALELEPNHPNTWLNMTLLRLQSGNLEGARAAAERCRRLAPDDPATHHAAGLVARARGNLTLAEAELRQAARAEAQGSRVLVDLGVLLSETGRHTEAISLLRRAVEAEPGVSHGRLSLAVALLRAGRIDAGIEVLQRLVEERPRDVLALVTLSRAHLARGDRAAARQILRRAEEIAPSDRRVQGARREVGNDP